MTDQTTAPTGVVSSTELGQPIAYLYHDANTPKDAHPWLHSTMLVLAADRREGLRGEIPLVTLEQAESMVAAERERCASICDVHAAGWDENQGINPQAGFIASRNCAYDIRRPNTN